jgi:hypothetical protein
MGGHQLGERVEKGVAELQVACEEYDQNGSGQIIVGLVKPLGLNERGASDLYGARQRCSSNSYGVNKRCASDLYRGEECASDLYREGGARGRQ